MTLRFYLDQTWQVPLVLVILVFFALGAALGVLACLARLFAQRREILALKRELQERPHGRGAAAFRRSAGRLMEFEFWWLLGFPLFFGLGWLAARIDIKQLLSESRNLPRSYFKGLNFLLNEQPDKAIEAFIEVVRVDPETVELHFALGSLFRRRGETERAIRMHKNLLERTDLGEEQRLQALFELGQDYLRAGLLDRAEEVFLRLLDGRAPRRGAQVPARDLPAGEGLDQGDRHRRRAWSAIPGSRGRRRSPITTASWRSPRRRIRGRSRRGTTWRRHWPPTASACGRHMVLGDLAGRGRRPRARHRGLEAHRAAEPRVSRAGGAAPARRPPRTRPR